MRRISYAQAIREALAEEMRRDPSVFLLGEDIGEADPVLFFEHKGLYSTAKGVVPTEEYTIPLGQGIVRRPGRDVTVVATLKLVDEALRAAELLEQEGISVEVFDPRTLVPLDLEGIINSVRKTGHLVIAHEAVRRCGPGAEIAALVAEEAWDALKGPMVRVAAENVPVPYAPELEKRVLPDAQRVVQGVCRALAATGQRQVVEV